MLRKMLYPTLFLVTLMMIVFFGCKKEDEIVISEFQLFIDSIAAPDTIELGAIYTVEFYAILGQTDCYLFQKFEVSTPSNQILISLIGGFTEDQDCDSVEQKLSGELLRIYDLSPGDYSVRINQPRDIPIDKTLHVRE